MWNEIVEFLTTQLHTNQFFSGAALTGVLMSVLYSLKTIPERIWSRIYRWLHYSTQVEDTSYKLLEYLNIFIELKYPNKLRNTETELKGDSFISSGSNDFMYVWYKWRLLRISKTKKRLENANSTDNAFSRTYSIGGFLAKKQITALLEEVRAKAKEHIEAEENKNKKPRIYMNDDWGNGNNYIGDVKGRVFDQLYIQGKERIIRLLDKHKESNLYEKFNIPNKLGLIFYGLPGNGKSSLASAIAHYMKYDILTVNLCDLTDNQFIRCISRVKTNTIILFEDFDTVFNGRTGVSDKIKLSFSTLLNALSGIQTVENVITIFTTNKIDTFDEALLRAGRCDLLFEVAPPDQEGVKAFIEYFYETKLDRNYSFKEVSGAELQNTMLYNNLENTLSLLTNGEEIE